MKWVTGFLSAVWVLGMGGVLPTPVVAGPPPSSGAKSPGGKTNTPGAATPGGRPVVKTAAGLQITPLGPDFVLDGQLSEWKGSPTLNLGAANQVAGSQKPVDTQDIAARIWIAQKGSELILAADVTDDTWRPPGSDADDHERIRSDHLEIWLSFAEPNFPPISFGNQFGETAVPNTAACKEIEEVAACEKWWKAQVTHRRQLEEGFVRQLITDGESLWVIRGGNLELASGQLAARKERVGGYTLEVRIPVGAWPALRQANTGSAKLLVDLIDNDQGADRQETFLSSSGNRDPKDRSTWNVAKLAEPVVLAPAGSLLATLLGEGHFVLPTSPRLLYQFLNIPVGYQYTPTEPSPTRLELTLPDAPSITVGDTQLWWVGKSVYTTVKGSVRAKPLPLGCSPQVIKSGFGGQAELVAECDLSNSPFGAGPCGACPARTFEVIGVGKDGLAQVRADLFFTSAPCGGSIERAAAPDLSWVALRTETCKDEGPKYTGMTLKRDPATGVYQQSEGFAKDLKWTTLNPE